MEYLRLIPYFILGILLGASGTDYTNPIFYAILLNVCIIDVLSFMNR